ncbi:hypothetical protein CABS01_16710 [Colletotrichum abscissum]|uniref:uncharacterized protein n=1 Tax=Colletotrichum abscissum TaxID=1671311 RepID=UPI0027D65F75|nr:uncharacterized protein CABS01_16710 [Colletotrichum abscissum]KAK1515417.1 hypothetical protein CABS01_16710 [Colletotrichum abscissum]
MEPWRLQAVATLEISEEGRPRPMSKFVMDNRDSIFRLLSFDECAAIALYVKKHRFDTLRLEGEDSPLQDERDVVIKALATRAVERFSNDAMLKGLYKMTSPLQPMHRCRVLLEAALHYAKYLHSEKEKKEWQKLCSKQLATLQPTDATTSAESRKRRPEEDLAAHKRSKKRRGEIAQPLAAKMADIQAIPNFIGTFLFVGLTRSNVRQKDVLAAMTAAFEMHFASQEFQDFTLLLTVDKSIGEILREPLSGSLDKLEIYLGRWLIDAVRAARDGDNRYLYPHDNNEDMILELGLGFQHGREMAHVVFPMR